eukprot:g7841.t1
MKTSITLAFIAAVIVLCFRNDCVHAGNIRGLPQQQQDASMSAGSEGMTPTSTAKGINDFRPEQHSPEDVTEENIRNKPGATLGAASSSTGPQDLDENDLNRNETITHDDKLKGNGNENRTSDDDNRLSEADEIEARMKDTDAMRAFVRGHLENVHSLIQSEHERLERERQKEIARAKEERKKALEEELHNSVKLHTYVNRLKKRRKEINKCLDIIHGGADKLYWDLRKRFSRIPAGAVCLALKQVKFPHIPIVGFKEDIFRKYVGWEPPSDGSTVIYYDAIKTHVFRCMCEEKDLTRLHTKSIVAASMKPPVDNIENMASLEAQKINDEMKQEEQYTKKQDGVSDIPAAIKSSI